MILRHEKMGSGAPYGFSAGLNCRPPCLTTPPHQSACCLLGLRLLLRTPERSLGVLEACGGPVSSPRAAQR